MLVVVTDDVRKPAKINGGLEKKGRLKVIKDTSVVDEVRSVKVPRTFVK